MVKKKGKKESLDFREIPCDHPVIYSDSFIIFHKKDKFHMAVCQDKMLRFGIKDGNIKSVEGGITPTLEIRFSIDEAINLYETLYELLERVSTKSKKEKKKKGKK